jgi:hypothetical protein
MNQFFTNRELARKLGIRLTKWKRWSRDFLPPDPLGGLQSGYARQYSFDQAFMVYFGGFLVAELKFSVPEARQIMSDLTRWMDTNNGNSLSYTVIVYIVRCRRSASEAPCLTYIIREILSNQLVNRSEPSIKIESYRQTVVGPPLREAEPQMLPSSRMINITQLQQIFVSLLQAS